MYHGPNRQSAQPALQLGLNFAAALPELLAGKEMGDDTLRALNEIIPLQNSIRAAVAAELPHLPRNRQMGGWAAGGNSIIPPPPKRLYRYIAKRDIPVDD